MVTCVELDRLMLTCHGHRTNILDLLCFQVSVVGETINTSGQSNCTPVKVPECRLSDDLGQLFDGSTFSDVTLCVGGREFEAHKALLAGTEIIN